jgi:hypothetical protein
MEGGAGQLDGRSLPALATGSSDWTSKRERRTQRLQIAAFLNEQYLQLAHTPFSPKTRQTKPF